MQTDIRSLFRVSEIEISYKHKAPVNERINVSKSETAYEILKHSWDENKIELLEQFKILLLNGQNQCLGLSELATGAMDLCYVDQRLLFALALKAKAPRLILAHNHPSGQLKPSNADIALTKRLQQGGNILGIEITDHLIVASHNYYSFADQGMMPL